ncbi:hypothetical protein CU254_23265 [Amycolatopsis sp. AA4]|nr:hypothetical protein CU254_23265 [Amycolatopsis sp. AA4]
MRFRRVDEQAGARRQQRHEMLAADFQEIRLAREPERPAHRRERRHPFLVGVAGPRGQQRGRFRREHEQPDARQRPGEPAELRAIPHRGDGDLGERLVLRNHVSSPAARSGRFPKRRFRKRSRQSGPVPVTTRGRAARGSPPPGGRDNPGRYFRRCQLTRRGHSMLIIHEQRSAGRSRRTSMRNGSPCGTAPIVAGVRDAERAHLVSALEARPAFIVVEGLAGAGKSCLAAHALAALGTRPDRVLTAYCGAESQRFPYHVATALFGNAGIELAIPPDPVREALFPRIRRALARLGACVLLIEDLHWADAASLDLLRYVLRDPPPDLTVLGTRRTGARPRTALAPGPIIPLGPLSTEETAALAAHLAGGNVSPGAVSRIESLTGGLPLYFGPVLDALRRTVRGPLDEQAVDAVFGRPLPAALTSWVSDRLGDLAAGARKVAEAAAVLAEPETAEALASVSGLPPRRVRGYVLELLRHGHFAESRGYRYGFRADLDRLAVYHTVPGPRRQRMHQLAAAMLDARDPQPMRRLVAHARRSGTLRAWLAQSEQATEDAVEVGDSASAMAILRTAITDDSLSTVERLRAIRRFCALAPAVVDQERNARLLRALLHDQRLPRPDRARVRLGYGLLLVRQAGGVEHGRTEIERAVAELEAQPELALRGVSLLCAPYLGAQPVSRHLPWLERAEKSLSGKEAAAEDIPILANVLGARVHLGHRVEADRLAPYGDLAATAELRQQLARAHCNLADGHSWIGDTARAQELLHLGLDLATGAGASFVVGSAEATQIRLDWAAGRWERIDERADELERSYPGLHPVVCELKLVKAWYAIAQGNWSEGRRNLQGAGLADLRNAVAPVAIAAWGALIHTLLDGDAAVQAAREASQAVEYLRRKEGWAWSGELLPYAGQAFLEAGLEADADRLIADAEAALADRYAPLAEASLLAARALRAGDRAAEAYDAAAAAHARIGHHYRAGQLTERAALLRWQDGDSAAKDELRLLAERFDLMGATIDAGRCQRHLRTRSAAPVRPREHRGAGSGLSPREEQVEQLVLDGRTNQEIADVLFLSRRTVEEHVANVLRKRGVRSRHDLRRA